MAWDGTPPEVMAEALSATHDIAMTMACREGVPREIQHGLDLIASIGRYKHNVAGTQDRELYRIKEWSTSSSADDRPAVSALSVWPPAAGS